MRLTYCLRMEEVRKLIVTICYTVSASIFWGAVAAAGVRHAFKVDPGTVLLCVGLPVGLAFFLFLFPRLRKIIVASSRY